MPRTLLHAASSTSSAPLSADSLFYIYALAPATSTILAGTCSDDSLRLFSAATLAATGCVVGAHHGGVTGLVRVGENVLATAGRDGCVRVWDVRDGGTAAAGVYRSGLGAPVLSLAVDAGAGVVAAGTELVGGVAGVLVWDLRTAGVKAQYTESHNDDITALAFHPDAAHLLLSGATDGLLSIHDLLTPPPSTTTTNTTNTDDDALHQVVNHGSSIHRAGFLRPVRGSRGCDMYALSHDEQLALYKLVEEVPEDAERVLEEAESRVWGDVRAGLGCEYVVDVVPCRDGGGVVVVGSHGAQWVDLVPLVKRGPRMEGWDMLRKERVRLQGGHGGEVVRGVWVDEEAGTIYTAGEDGLVKAWRGGATAETEAVEPAAEKQEKREKRTKEERRERRERRERKEAKARYRPY